MTEPADQEPDQDGEAPRSPSRAESSMDSLETAYGRSLDPGIELDPGEASETETVAGVTPNYGAPESRGPTATAATTGMRVRETSSQFAVMKSSLKTSI